VIRSSRRFEHLPRHGVLLACFVAFALSAIAQDRDDDDRAYADRDHKETSAYTLTRVKSTSAQLPPSVLSLLQPLGYRVSGEYYGGKGPICEVFWAKAVRTEAGSTTDGILYGNLKQGSLIGVIHFRIIERYVRDYRSQMLRPGYYTMRYAVMPKGANENEPRDFVLLTPVNADPSPASTLPLPRLVHLSRLASEIKHPVALSLVAVDPDEKLPSLITDEEGTSTLQVKLRASARPGQTSLAGTSQDVPLALVVITAIPEDLGD
jgi:hypothetical protein